MKLFISEWYKISRITYTCVFYDEKFTLSGVCSNYNKMENWQYLDSSTVVALTVATSVEGLLDHEREEWGCWEDVSIKDL